MSIRADINRVMVNGIFVSADRPSQAVGGYRGGHGQTIVNPGFYLGCLFIIVPRNQLQVWQRILRVVDAVDFGECLQPGLAALLSHDPVGSPGSQGVVESLVRGPHRLFSGKRFSRLIKAFQVVHAVIRRGRHHPGIAARTRHLAESAIVLEYKGRLHAQRNLGRSPVDGGIGEADVEIGDDRLASNR